LLRFCNRFQNSHVHAMVHCLLKEMHRTSSFGVLGSIILSEQIEASGKAASRRSASAVSCAASTIGTAAPQVDEIRSAWYSRPAATLLHSASCRSNPEFYRPTTNLVALCPLLLGSVKRLAGKAWQAMKRSGKITAMLQCGGCWGPLSRVVSVCGEKPWCALSNCEHKIGPRWMLAFTMRAYFQSSRRSQRTLKVKSLPN
jgi:hypothetical protein